MAESKDKGGRPEKEIDYRMLEKLSRLQLPVEDLCNLLEISPRTYYYRMESDEVFAQKVAKGKSHAKTSLRRAQMYYAMKGNAALLIFLGKNMLNQSDSPSGGGDDELDIRKNVHN
jgi:hypothetical protein